MNDRELALLLILLAAAGDRPSNGVEDGNLFSRFTRRATGVVVDAVDPDEIIDKVDINALLDRIDVNDLLDRVDPDALLDRVDVNRLLDRVDVNALMERVDVDALMDRVDVEALVDRAGISDIVKESTGALAGSALDVFRRQLVALDTILGRTLYRLRGRDPATRPEAPEALDTVGTGVDETGRGQITGHYAGGVTRLLAFVADMAVVTFAYFLVVTGFQYLVDLTNVQLDSVVVGAIAFAGWASLRFLYFWISYAVAGKTIGMALIGLRVVNRQGGPLTGRQAAIRTIVLPISTWFFAIGCIGILFSPERRALQDAAAGSVIIYDWGDRPAELAAPLTRWIAERSDVSVDLPGASAE